MTYLYFEARRARPGQVTERARLSPRTPTSLMMQSRARPGVWWRENRNIWSLGIIMTKVSCCHSAARDKKTSSIIWPTPDCLCLVVEVVEVVTAIFVNKHVMYHCSCPSLEWTRDHYLTSHISNLFLMVAVKLSDHNIPGLAPPPGTQYPLARHPPPTTHPLLSDGAR